MEDKWLNKKPKKLLEKGKRDDSGDGSPIVVSIKLKPEEEQNIKRSQLMSVDDDILSDVDLEDLGGEGPGPG